MQSFVWVVPPEQAFGDLTEAYTSTIRAGVLDVVERRAPEITDWMQQNAPWQDITGVARASLAAEVFQLSNDLIEIYMSHGAYYGIWLETRNAGRYAIIEPALDVWSRIVWNDILEMMRG